jgi:hypothetical protein
VLPLLVIGGVYGGFRYLGANSCSGAVRLLVAASPEIAPAIKSAADRWTSEDPKVSGQCVEVEVVSQHSADAATTIAAEHGLSVAGLGQADGRSEPPDVWIPDSSIWLQRMRALRDDIMPAEAGPVARSPVAVAMPEPTARALGWIDAKLNWATIVRQIVSDTRMHPGIVDPKRDSASISALVSIAKVVPSLGPNGDEITVAAVKALQQGRSELTPALLLRFPRDTQPRSMASALTVAPLSEQAILAYNASGPAVQLATLYPEPLAVALDFPYTIMPRLSPDRAEAASALRSVLNGATFRNELAAQHLRAADGTAGPALTLGPTAPNGPRPVDPTPEPVVIANALKMWVEITRPSRMLALIDVSAAMASPIGPPGSPTRQQVAVQAAKGGLELFDPSWTVGLWTYSTLLDGDRDYVQLLPIGSVGEQKAQIASALDSVAPKADGGTALYDSVLAAYKELRRGWDPHRGNTLVVITGSRNNDPNGLSLDGLLTELRRNSSADQPTQIIFIGIGTDVSEPDLKKITAVTGGGVFVTQDPAKIGEIFVKALALMDQ